jgi:hypothetical protein
MVFLRKKTVLGFPFTIDTPYGPDECRARIRAMKGKSISVGQRVVKPTGYLMGPFAYLTEPWLKVHRPEIYARIRAHGSGSRLSGRAGFSLLATALNFLWYPLLLFAAYRLLFVPGATEPGCTTVLSLLCIPNAILDWGVLVFFTAIVIFWTRSANDDHYLALGVIAFLEETLDGKAVIEA